MRHFLFLLLSVFSLQIIAQQGTCGPGNNAKWKFDITTKTLTIYGKGNTFDFDNPYFSWGTNRPAWSPYKKQIKHLVIEDGITSIGEYTFTGLDSLEDVSTKGFSLKHINNYAFQDCNSLHTVNLSDSLNSIGFKTFESCTSLKNITIPNGVKLIKSLAFSNCCNIETVYYDAIDALCEMYVFSNCTKLKEVNFGTQVKGVPDYLFKDVKNLSTLINTDNIEYVGGNTFSGTTWQNNLPTDKLIYIGKAAYLYKKVTTELPLSIKLKEGTKSISSYAFDGNGMLSKIEIPKSLDRIGDNAFRNCSGLGEVIWNADSVGNFTNYSPFSNSLWSITLAEGVRHIPAYFLADCTGFDQLTLPSTLRSIGAYAFNNCSGLTKLLIPNSVNFIDNNALSSCTNIDTLVVNARVCYDNLTNLPNLKCVTFGKNLSTLNFYHLLNDSRKLNEVRWNSENKVENSVSYGETKIAVPYKKLVFGNNVKRVYAYFERNDDLKEIIWGDSLKSIAAKTFSHCKNLNSLNFPSGLEYIGNDAFRECINLTYVKTPDSLHVIGDNAFYHCTSLNNIYFPDALTQIGASAFEKTNITEFFIPQNVQSIGRGALVSNRIDKIIIATDKVSSSDAEYLFNNINLTLSDSAKIYVPDAEPYSNNLQVKNHIVSLIVSDSVSAHVYDGKSPLMNFRGNLPGYKVTLLDEKPSLEVNAGKHKAILKATFAGDRMFTINTIWNYEINKADQEIIWNKNLDKLGIGDSILIATATSGLAVKVHYFKNLPTTNIIKQHADGTYWLHCNETGPLFLSAIQNGDINWNPTNSIKSILVHEVSAITNVAASKITVKGENSKIKIAGTKSRTKVMVYDTTGRLIHSAETDTNGLNIPTTRKGLYMVKVLNRTYKVIVK